MYRVFASGTICAEHRTRFLIEFRRAASKRVANVMQEATNTSIAQAGQVVNRSFVSSFTSLCPQRIATATWKEKSKHSAWRRHTVTKKLSPSPHSKDHHRAVAGFLTRVHNSESDCRSHRLLSLCFSPVDITFTTIRVLLATNLQIHPADELGTRPPTWKAKKM